MSISYFCSPFFLLKARFIVEKVSLRGPSWVSANIPPGKAAGRSELKMALTSSLHYKAESLKTNCLFLQKKSPPSESEAMFSCQNVFKLKSQAICITVVYHWATSHSSSVEAVILTCWKSTHCPYCSTSQSVSNNGDFYQRQATVLYSKMWHCLLWSPAAVRGIMV